MKAYIFCPAPHRLTILCLFVKHASQHPLLPERHGDTHSAELLRRDAVTEMYRHCEVNRLCKVWAYLQNSWYRLKRWNLWTCAAHPIAIPAHRTTMMVEALWRNLKRLTFQSFNRPPLDLATYAIITKVIPPYRQTLMNLTISRGGGHPQPLTNMQVKFKGAWERLLKAPIKGSYKTDISMWTCNCGAQKYHANMLCKHLVQAAGPMPPSWWTTVVRYHIWPFYTVPINGNIAPVPESNECRAWVTGTTQSMPQHGQDSDSDSVHIPSDSDNAVSIYVAYAYLDG